MLSEPVTITVNGVGKVLARTQLINQSNTTGSVYESSDGNWKLTVSHQRSKDKIRTLTKFEQRVVATDPLTAAQDYAWLTESHVTDRPIVGFTQAQVEQQIVGFNDWQKSNAVQVKLFGLES